MTIIECVNEKTALNLNPFHGLIYTYKLVSMVIS